MITKHALEGETLDLRKQPKKKASLGHVPKKPFGTLVKIGKNTSKFEDRILYCFERKEL